MVDRPTTPPPPEPLPDDLRQALERAESLLPWAANGTLSAADQTWLDGWLASTERGYPEQVAPLRAELAWLRHTAQDVRSNVHLPDSEQGLDTLLRRIASDKAAARQMPESRRPTQPTGLWGRALAWVNGHGLQLAGACAVLVIAQGTTLALLAPTGTEWGLLGGEPVVPGVRGTVLLQATFNPQATEASLRQVLREAHAEIVSGPSALGVYLLRVKADEAEAAIALLRTKVGVVDSVSKAP